MVVEKVEIFECEHCDTPSEEAIGNYLGSDLDLQHTDSTYTCPACGDNYALRVTSNPEIVSIQAID